MFVLRLHIEKRHAWSAKRIVTLLCTLLALLVAISATAVWMFIGYRQSTVPNAPESSDSPPQYTEPMTKNCSLVIFDFMDSPRFVLVQTDPARQAIWVANVPETISDDAGDTLSVLLKKHGSLRVVQTISSVLELKVEHYITWSSDGANTFLSELHKGISFEVKEDIHYTDSNGTTVRLNAGLQPLTGAQAAAILQYRSWHDPKLYENIACELIAAVFNQYLLPEQNVDGYFATLSDTAQTDLRIDNYNGFRTTLAFLAEHNTGNICRILTLTGNSQNGYFIPDVQTMRSQSELYG